MALEDDKEWLSRPPVARITVSKNPDLPEEGAQSGDPTIKVAQNKPIGDLYDEIINTMQPELAPAAKPAPHVPAVGAARTPYDSIIDGFKQDEMFEKNETWTNKLGALAKFSGHGTLRGLAETLGMPSDVTNVLAEYVRNHPILAAPAAAVPGFGVPAASAGLAMAAIDSTQEKHTPAPRGPGTSDQVRAIMEGMGLPTKSPEEEGITPGNPLYEFAHVGDTVGEFGGANLPFIVGSPSALVAKGAKGAAKYLGKEAAFGGLGPGTGAALFEHVGGEENKETGKMVGAMLGSLRAGAIQGAWNGAKFGSSWLHNFLGFGTGAQMRVGEALQKTAQDLPTARAAVAANTGLPKNVDIPPVIQGGDDGHIGLLRAVAANDSVLNGQFEQARRDLEGATRAQTSLKPPRGRKPVGTPQQAEQELQNYIDTERNAMDQRTLQAVKFAEQSFAAATHGAEVIAEDSTIAKNAQGTLLRGELVNARDDLQAFTNSKWSKVDKKLPVDAEPVYDVLRTLEQEHLERKGEPGSRFPQSVVDMFYTKVPKEPTSEIDHGLKSEIDAVFGKQEGHDVYTEAEGEDRIRKFGERMTLQDVIDLDSAVQHEIRTALNPQKGAVDHVYLAYMNRISEALNEAKYALETPKFKVSWAPNEIANLKAAIAATKHFHETFSRGPVGKVLGFNAAGAPDVSPGATIKKLLTQGEAGVDAFNSMMQAVAARTGQGGKAMDPAVAMEKLIEQNLRQDFYDTVMSRGNFSQHDAEQWMRNHAGIKEHFPALHKQFTDSIASGIAVKDVTKASEKSLEQLRESKAYLYLNAEPGKEFEKALRGPNKYKSAKDLVALTQRDPTGRATEGLAQKALDHALNQSIVADKTSTRNGSTKIDGSKLAEWIEAHNSTLIKALDEALPNLKPKLSFRFKVLQKEAQYLSRFDVNPNLRPEESANMGGYFRDLVARLGGAAAGRHLIAGAGAIQSASIGSNAFKKLVAAMTPDQAAKLLRSALMDDKQLFLDLTAVGGTPAQQQARLQRIAPYFYSIGIPLSQPILAPDGKYYMTDPLTGGYMRVDP